MRTAVGMSNTITVIVYYYEKTLYEKKNINYDF